MISIDDAFALCKSAALGAGASEDVALSLTTAAVAAESRGQKSVGVSHLFDYLDAMKEGRLDGRAVPVIERPTAAVFRVDARSGIAQLGFDRVFNDLVDAARTVGIALFSGRNSYTCGALGYYVERLAEKGLVALATANAPAAVAAIGAKRALYGTNPMAFAAPQGGGPVLLIDQASSATAYVNVRMAAKQGNSLPEGWAIDKNGEPTRDPVAALAGALLPFGGVRGGNIALMVEVMSAMSGANWSLDAPSWVDGNQCPGIGLSVIAFNPTLLDPSFESRLANHLAMLRSVHGVFIPGFEKADALAASVNRGLDIDDDMLQKLRTMAG
ncbi:Ldh family oxidoreductase [Caballeronia sordidicola]|uniref:Malate dehydrogenase n=1 Tax=Caballeronia sordidicola TaxID=196367 RepID=A0A226X319_CABSO|nr:Ldh family oxidoreductase [Caballeronia sordidicola]OXC77519.1 Malate dehydrogenase [Caballeronia sordidicola]